MYPKHFMRLIAKALCTRRTYFSGAAVLDSALVLVALLWLMGAAGTALANAPREVRIATVYWKPARNRTALKPDFFVHETDAWLVFPHEINGLTVDEIRRNKPEAAMILRGEP